MAVAGAGLAAGGMPARAQWTKLPPGASGSRITSTSSRVPFGTPDQRSGIGRSLPSQVYCFGIAPFGLNAEVFKRSAPERRTAGAGVVFVGVTVVDAGADAPGVDAAGKLAEVFAACPPPQPARTAA